MNSTGAGMGWGGGGVGAQAGYLQMLHHFMFAAPWLPMAFCLFVLI